MGWLQPITMSAAWQDLLAIKENIDIGHDMAIYPAIAIGHDMAMCPAMPLDNKMLLFKDKQTDRQTRKMQI